MNIDRILSATAVLAAIAMTVAVLRRAPHSEAPTAIPAPGTVFDKRWREHAQAGRAIGSPQAPVSIIYFSEVECPYCRKFEVSLRRIDSLFPGKTSRIFVHFPLPSHSNAIPAAIALECAGAEDKFGELLSAAFDRRNVLGAIDWPILAHEVGVQDTVAFKRCQTAPSSRVAIDRGIAAGKRIGIRGTPTVFINGWRIDGSPPDSVLERITRRILMNGRPSS
jgi:protein-disulfide isomerase